MAHLRKRHILPAVEKLLTHSPIVGILGHRQVGKTTLLESLSNHYESFDDEDSARMATKSAKKYLASMKGNRLAIDECQLVPAIFPALKEKVRKSKRPGQYLLSGSVRFTSQKAIQESLTGRISTLELFPLSASEIEEEALGNYALQFQEWGSLKSLVESISLPTSEFNKRQKALEKYLLVGGLPGLCFIREEQLRKNQCLNLLKTTLDRDLRQISETTLSFQDIYRFTQGIAQSPLTAYNAKTLKRDTGISEVTQKKLLLALESIFLIRQLPIEGDYKGSLIWLEDQFEEAFLRSTPSSQEEQWIGLIYRNLRTQYEYRIGMSSQYFSFKTRGGANVPLCLKNSLGTLGIIPTFEKVLTRKLKASADSFLKNYNHSKVLFISVGQKKAEYISERMAIVPAEIALF